MTFVVLSLTFSTTWALPAPAGSRAADCESLLRQATTVDYWIKLLKERIVDRISLEYQGGTQVDLPLKSGVTRHLRVVARLGSGMYGTVYQIAESDDPGINAYLTQGYQLVAKFPHLIGHGRALHPTLLPIMQKAAQDEVRDYQRLVDAFARVQADPSFPQNSPWSALPLVPILESLDTAIGLVTIKPVVQGMDIAALGRRYGRGLTPEIVKGLREYYDFTQALSHVLHGEVRGHETTSGFSADIRPPNLVWIEEEASLRALKMTRPGFVAFELTQLQGNEPRYLSPRMSFEDYLRLFQSYVP